MGLQREKLQQITQKQTLQAVAPTCVHGILCTHNQLTKLTNTFSEHKEEGRDMIDQQVTNILRHLKIVHNISKHEVTEEALPKGTAPSPGTCKGNFHLFYSRLAYV